MDTKNIKEILLKISDYINLNIKNKIIELSNKSNDEFKGYHSYRLEKDWIFFSESCKVFEKYQNYFYSYRLRPKEAAQIHTKNFCNNLEDRCALVMQGPIEKEENFTLETLMLYKKMYPRLNIILSTWEDEDKDYLEKIKKIGVLVIQSNKPENAGYFNRNLQLKSTKKGIEKAKELRVDYIFKTRTDQRFYKPDILSFFISLLEVFPCNDFLPFQKKRIIALEISAHKNIFNLYFVSDFLFFGCTEDMVQLFSIPYDNRKKEEYEQAAEEKLTAKQGAEIKLNTEIYIMSEYLKSQGIKPEFNIKSYWEFIKSCLIFVDYEMVGFYWLKYDYRYCDNVRNGSYIKEETENQYFLYLYKFNFENWLNLYSGNLAYKEEYEKFADYIDN